MYVHVYTCVYMHVCIYMCVYAHVYICLVCMCVYIYTCVCVCVCPCPLPLEPLSHCTPAHRCRSSQSTELSSLCYVAASR